MNIGPAIFSILSNDATLTAELGGNKIYPIKAPQRVGVPYIIYKQISSIGNDTKDGVSTLDEIRTQFDVFHNDFDLCHTVIERLRTLIEKYRGSVAGVNIDSVKYLTLNEAWEDEDDDFRVSTDYQFREQKTPTDPGGNGTIFNGWMTQRFNSHTGNTITVTAGTLPTQDFDANLVVSREGRELYHTTDYTVSGNVITLNVQAIGENFLIKFNAK